MKYIIPNQNTKSLFLFLRKLNVYIYNYYYILFSSLPPLSTKLNILNCLKLLLGDKNHFIYCHT